MKYLFIFLTVTVILSQSVHTWFVFQSFSRIKQSWLKTAQAIMFCSIISIAILAFVLSGEHKLALAGAIVEIIINIYYYAIEFWETGYKAFTGDKNEVKRKRVNSVLRFWRRNWIAKFFGIIMPISIYVFSLMLVKWGHLN